MREVAITKGMVVLIDDEDYERVVAHKWYALKSGDHWYADRKSKDCEGLLKHHVLMHRYIMSVPKGLYIDHVDNNGLNNCKSNLRIVTHAQNMANKGRVRTNSSQYKGVHWYKPHQLWVATIGKDRQHYHLGYFENEDEAARAYNSKAVELFGEYARLNIIPTEEKF